MRWWAWVGVAAVAVVAVAALSVPWVPATATTTVPVEREWTLTDAESGHCVDAGFSTTLEGTELRPVISAFPWRAWTDASFPGDTVLAVHSEADCGGTGEVTQIGASVMLGNVACAAWETDQFALVDQHADMVAGCDASAVRLDAATTDPRVGFDSHQEMYQWFEVGRDGCVDLAVWGTITWVIGDAATSSIADGPEPERICLSVAD